MVVEELEEHDEETCAFCRATRNHEPFEYGRGVMPPAISAELSAGVREAMRSSLARFAERMRGSPLWESLPPELREALFPEDAAETFKSDAAELLKLVDKHEDGGELDLPESFQDDVERPISEDQTSFAPETVQRMTRAEWMARNGES